MSDTIAVDTPRTTRPDSVDETAPNVDNRGPNVDEPARSVDHACHNMLWSSDVTKRKMLWFWP
jgi:hypothetical protein